MAEGEGLLWQVGGQGPTGELRVGTNKSLRADYQGEGADGLVERELHHGWVQVNL